MILNLFDCLYTRYVQTLLGQCIAMLVHLQLGSRMEFIFDIEYPRYCL